MEFDSKIGPMICVTVNKIIQCSQKDSMAYYKILIAGAMMAATQLHAFKVIRDGEELFLPTHMLQKDDKIWIDQSAFMADGSLILKNKNKVNKECLPGNTKVLVPIDDIVANENGFIFQVASITIQSSNNHLFTIIRKNQRKVLEAYKIEIGDLFEIDISLLSSGNKIVGSDGKYYNIQ